MVAQGGARRISQPDLRVGIHFPFQARMGASAFSPRERDDKQHVDQNSSGPAEAEGSPCALTDEEEDEGERGEEAQSLAWVRESTQ